MLGLGLGLTGQRRGAASPPPPPPDLLAGLLAFWRFDGSGADSSGSGNNLTPSNSYLPGLIGQCLYDTGAVLPVSWAFTECTYSFWYQPGEDREEGAQMCRVNAGRYLFAKSNSGGTGAVQGFGTLHSFAISDVHEWMHAVAVTSVTGGVTTEKLYLNGVEVASAVVPAVTGATIVEVYATSDYPGTIDLAGVWGRALSPAEILALYNDGAGFDPTA
jgi:hypothetical protein